MALKQQFIHGFEDEVALTTKMKTHSKHAHTHTLTNYTDALTKACQMCHDFLKLSMCRVEIIIRHHPDFKMSVKTKVLKLT